LDVAWASKECQSRRSLALTPTLEGSMKPVRYPPAELFLVSQLGCGCPK
jgi:hypothetical protein